MEMEKRNTDKNDDNPCGGCSTNPIRRLQCGTSEEGMSYLKLEAWRWEWEGESTVGCRPFGDKFGQVRSDWTFVQYHVPIRLPLRLTWPRYWLHSYKRASTCKTDSADEVGSAGGHCQRGASSSLNAVPYPSSCPSLSGTLFLTHQHEHARLRL